MKRCGEQILEIQWKGSNTFYLFINNNKHINGEMGLHMFKHTLLPNFSGLAGLACLGAALR